MQEIREPDRQVTVRLPEDLHRRFKIALIQDGRTMQELLASLVERYVERQEADRA